MDCSLPGSSVHGIFQAIVVEWIAISFSRGSSRPRVRTRVSCIVDRCFTVWATRGGQNKGGDASPYYIPPTAQKASQWNPSWLRDASTQVRRTQAKPNTDPNTVTITIKPEIASPGWAVLLVSLPSCSLLQHLLPIKSFALLARVSTQTIHFQVLNKCPLPGLYSEWRLQLLPLRLLLLSQQTQAAVPARPNFGLWDCLLPLLLLSRFSPVRLCATP